MRKISEYTEKVVSALNEAHPPTQVSEGQDQYWYHRFFGLPGQRFDRVAFQREIATAKGEPTWPDSQRFVQCFVERETGDIHYSAGWKAPAKWTNGPAVEWHASEAQRYAEFVKDGGWGYQGQRAKWEAEHPVEVTPDEVTGEWPVKAPEKFDIKAFAALFAEARMLAKAMPTNDRWQDRFAAHRLAWAALTGTTDNDKQDDEVNAVLDRTGHVAYTSDLT